MAIPRTGGEGQACVSLVQRSADDLMAGMAYLALVDTDVALPADEECARFFAGDKAPGPAMVKRAEERLKRHGRPLNPRALAMTSRVVPIAAKSSFNPA